MEKAKILLVDDEANVLKQMRWALEPDYEVLTSSDEAEARQIFEAEKPAVVTLDLSLNPELPEDLGGMRLLEEFLSIEPSTRAIVITGNSEESSALNAVRLGAFDYYSKPIRLEEIQVMIQRAFKIFHLHKRLQQTAPATGDKFHGIIGKSPSMQEIYRFIERVALSDISVLISGESGTGKELVAQAIHHQSQRRDNPFVVVNCGAIPENLLESELFGHEKGAFTGAYAQKKGKFELAHTGTLFLDEIGELVPALQVKLLRFLQDRKIERIGSNQSIELDVRIIAATNRDLRKDMENRVFREDLYYRLKVVPLDLPPLRERREDIVPLAQHFLRKFCQEQHKPPITLSPEAEGALLMHPWPGNVRELENLISRAAVLSTRMVLKPSDLGFAMDRIPTDVNLKFAKKAIEIDFVKKALSKNKGIVSRAARDLGISRVNLYELMEKYNIRIQEFKANRTAQKQQLKPGEVI
ncbi:MAG TPA: PEP-CTERM-box response regulator transcription factor [Terriglobales bacterium]|nr:PEP-CTERM-box response regulator transcription factor [Terriglobales bacterium]